MLLKRKMLLVNTVSLEKKKEKEKEGKKRNPPWGFSRKIGRGKEKRPVDDSLKLRKHLN